ncbi:MAG: hypothetical protein KJ600_02650 [Nanoarchaeota archaeon]|nr:hypothetical protein [Nanoarchaeota archaeon]
MKETMGIWTNRYNALRAHLVSESEGTVETELGKGKMAVHHYNGSTVITYFEERGAPFNLKITAMST